MPIHYKEFINNNFDYFNKVSCSLKKCSKALRTGNKNNYIYSIREFCNIEPHSFFTEYHEEIVEQLNENIKILEKLEMLKKVSQIVMHLRIRNQQEQ